MIGSLGEVAFEVSGEKVLTFDNLGRDSSARITFHELIGVKPLAEFIGPGVEIISFNITLSSFLGVDATEEIKILREIRDTGKAVSLSFDGIPQGDGLWLVESIKETWKYIDKRGNPRVIDCGLQLKEYAEAN